MDVIYKSCCGIDVHKDKLVACVNDNIRMYKKWNLYMYKNKHL